MDNEMGFVRKKFEEGKGLRYLMNKLEALGWKNLFIGPYHRDASGVDKTDDGFYYAWDLRGCQPDYDGPHDPKYYRETLAITVIDKKFKEIGMDVREDIANIF
jgi:hypothetical protein